MAISDSRRLPWNLYLINNVEDIVVFTYLNVYNSYMLSWEHHDWKRIIFEYI